jgi:hypothetical protein
VERPRAVRAPSEPEAAAAVRRPASTLRRLNICQRP